MILVSVRQPTVVHDGQFAVNLTPVVDRHCPFLRSFKRGKIKCLQQGRVAGKHAALAVQPTVRGIQAFNGIGGVDHRPHILGELEDRADSVPVVVPALHGSGVFLLPFFRDFIQRFPAFLLGRCVVDRFQVIGECLPVLVRHIFQRVAYLVDNATLVFRFRECGSNRFFDSGKTVCTQKKL